MKTLLELYKNHTGKVSDKWSLYLDEYDRLFAPYRNEQTRLLEIGIQNGGSLEIWAKYFTEATHIIGCDINQDCKKLIYEDPRISVVVGDASFPETVKLIKSNCESFDIIIEDGSHKSGDIIKAFAQYFPLISDEGIFVAEDLHCSYWSEYEGGIHYPYSSMTFFKALADIVNQEHWGIDNPTRVMLQGFEHAYSTIFDEDALNEIHSVEFINSTCVIRKAKKNKNQLGSRFIAGDKELVIEGLRKLHSSEIAANPQNSNFWSALKKNPLEQIYDALTNDRQLEEQMLSTDLGKILDEYRSRLKALNESNTELEKTINQIQRTISEQKNQIKLQTETLSKNQTHIQSMLTTISEQKNQIKLQTETLSKNQTHIQSMLTSRSWRLTEPLRQITHLFRNCIGPRTSMKGVAHDPKQRAPTEDTPVNPASLKPSPSNPSFEILSGMGPILKPEIQLEDKCKLIAFYLPQYHRVHENSEWWGPGFTEWTNVVKGKPNYDGHYQPHLPRELGFYDLSNIEVMREQAELAKLYGVSAFCFYYYWFSGRRILEKPIQNFLESNIDIEYCLCWANENWTRTWDGDTRSVLLEQQYNEDDPLSFITSLLPYFNDERYIKVNGKPLLIVYRAKDIPKVEAVFEVWRDKAKAAGLPGLHIAVVDFYDISRPDEVGADALVEFPPHKFNGPANQPDAIPQITNTNFTGGIVDYAKVIAQSANRTLSDFTLYRGLIPSWDNTARRQNSPTIIAESDPELFEGWLRYIRTYTRHTFKDSQDPFIFVNAWNEWGEGCHLEPDQKWGLSYLESLKRSSLYEPHTDEIEYSRQRLLEAVAKSISSRSTAPTSGTKQGKLIDIRGVRQPSSFVQKIAYRLRRFPRLHVLGKNLYKLSNSLMKLFQK